jgi:hypothetical protein
MPFDPQSYACCSLPTALTQEPTIRTVLMQVLSRDAQDCLQVDTHLTQISKGRQIATSNA